MTVVLDIRTHAEYCRGHLPGAILVKTPLPPILSDVRDGLRRELSKTMKSVGANFDTPVIVYCKKGVRAGVAMQMLKQMGYRNVSSLGGVETEPLKSLSVTWLKC
jgi:rhodanese-related sulfurtransferase